MTTATMNGTARLIDGWCPNCGDVESADGTCPRCKTLLVKSHTQGAEDRTRFRLAPSVTVPAATTPAPGTPRAAVKLPATRATHAWHQQTTALLADLKAQREAKADIIRQTHAAVKELDVAIAGLEQLLASVQVPEIPASDASAGRAPGERRGRSLLNGRWSRKHEACVKCGRTELKHKANGLCQGCHR